uniref:Bicyclomycin resistant protein n=1 Tax=Actinosynnema pretiosum subsp. auranticum TaxID=42198 RepID=Q8KUI5_ACTPA|nr:bicyclomycin resistant protein [Actinosynnema pretiosum subsp. auranticum]
MAVGKADSAVGGWLPALLIVALTGTIIEIDMSVPSFPDIARELGVGGPAVQLTVTLNFLGYCLGALCHGPLSDRFGRRPVLLGGSAVMLVGALGCALAPTIGLLLTARFVQGIGASAAAVLVFVIIGDRYRGPAALRMYGLVNAAMSALMTCAPLLGGAINRVAGWRGNYLAVCATTALSLLLVFLFLPETRTRARTAITARSVLADYRRLLGSRAYLAASLTPSLLFAAYLVFIAASPFLYTAAFGLGVTGFALHLLVVVASFAVPSAFATGIIPLLGGPAGAVRWGLGAVVVGVLGFLLLGDGPVAVTGSVALFCVGFAVCYPVVFDRSMSVFPELAGAASSATMGLRALLVTLLTALAGALSTGGPFAPAAVMAGAVAAVVLLSALSPR